jgi:hypothetical protein
MITLFTVIVMLLVGYAFLAEGLFTACVMCINVFFAGVLAFNFFEPAAGAVEQMVAGTFLGGYEDAVCLVLIFALALYGLRSVTNQLAKAEVEFPVMVQRIGGAAFGLITGYLVSGFLVCALETLPWHVHFMGFQPGWEQDQFIRRFLPPDHVWLALMYRAGTHAFAKAGDTVDADGKRVVTTFDNEGNYDLRYARYRRYEDDRMPLPYYGEFDRDLSESPAALPAMPVMPTMPAPAAPKPAAPAGPATPGKAK